MSRARAMIRAWGTVAAGNGAAGALNLIAFALATRAAGLETFGEIALFLAWQRMFHGLFCVTAGSTVTAYAVRFQEAGDPDAFRGIIKAGFLANAASGAVAALLSILLLPLIAPVIGVSAEHVRIGQIVCLISAINICDATEAPLRIFDNFAAIALKDAIGAAVVVAALALFWATGRTGAEMALAWLIGAAAASAFHAQQVARTLSQAGHAAVRAADARAALRRAAGFWRAIIDQTAQTALRMITDQADILIVSAVLGPAAAAVFRAAKSLAQVVGLIGEPLEKAVSPEIARHWAAGDQRGLRRSVTGANAAGAALGLVALIAALLLGAQTMAVLFGPAYAAGGGALAAMVAAFGVTLTGVAIGPLSVTAGFSRSVLWASAAGGAAFLAAIHPALTLLGPLGAGLAHVAYAAVWLLWSAPVAVGALNRKRR